MVADRLGGLDQGVDEADRADEVAALEGFDDRVALPLLTVQVGQHRLDLVAPQQRHPGQA